MKSLLFFTLLLLPLTAAAEIDPVIDAVDRRLVDSAALTGASISKKPKRRALAANGYGRIMSEKGIDPLVRLSHDQIPFVREAAAFALGQLGWLPEASGKRLGDVQAALVALTTDKQLSVRLAAVEALGKVSLEKAPELLASSFGAKESSVRAAAVMAFFRSRMILKLRNPASPPGEVSDSVRERLVSLAGDKDGAVRMSVAYFLARNSEPKMEAVAAQLSSDKNKSTRMFAQNGLAKMKAKASNASILAGTRDAEYTVRLAALSAVLASEQALSTVSHLASDKYFHVRAAFAAGLKAARADEAELLNLLSRDSSPAVRVEALKALAKEKGEALLSWLQQNRGDSQWQVREAVVQASEPLKPEQREAFLQPVLSDSDINVKIAALEAIGAIPSESAFRLLSSALESEQLAVRGTAVSALKERKEAETVALAWKSYGASSGVKWVEVREELVDIFAKNSGDITTGYLRQLLQDPAYGVRAKARKALEERGSTDLPEAPAPELTFTPHRDLVFRSNPFIEIVTNRGSFVVECFAKAAPVHVADFVGNARNGYYDGLSWHRVVSNFVVQGGDPDGSGWGGSGYALRAEINQEPFLRGALGMPRSTGFDTGGSQLFFSHIPTPHLEGQYTVFGQVRKGSEVLDLLERGDRIISARVLRP